MSTLACPAASPFSELSSSAGSLRVLFGPSPRPDAIQYHPWGQLDLPGRGPCPPPPRIDSFLLHPVVRFLQPLECLLHRAGIFAVLFTAVSLTLCPGTLR